jgi:hypothetical protein
LQYRDEFLATKTSPVVVKTRQKALPSKLKHKRQAKTNKLLELRGVSNVVDSATSTERIPSVYPETSPNNMVERSSGTFTSDVDNITIGVEGLGRTNGTTTATTAEQLQQMQEQQLQPLLQQEEERGSNGVEGTTVKTLGSMVQSPTKSKRQRRWQPAGQSPASINNAPTASLILNNTMHNKKKNKNKGEYLFLLVQFVVVFVAVFGECGCGMWLWNVVVECVERVCGTCLWNVFVERACGMWLWNVVVKFICD